MGDQLTVSTYLSTFFENIIHFTSLHLLSKEAAKVKINEMKDRYDEHVILLKKSKEKNSSNGEIFDLLIRKTEAARDQSYSDLVEFQNQHHILFLYSQMERYLFQCFKYILINRSPEIIKEKTISISTILKKNKNFNLIIEEKVESIIVNVFYKDFKEILKFAKEKLGIVHEYTDDDIKTFNDFKALRNIFAHGDGTATSVYLEKVNTDELNLGDILIITEEMVRNFETKINQLLIKFDKVFLNSYPELDFLEDERIKHLLTKG